jgi:predicted small secreted protein
MISKNHLIVATLALSALSLTGCSNNTSFSQDSKSAAVLGAGGLPPDTGDLPGVNDPTTQEVANECEAAEASGRLLSQTATLKFADPGHACLWNQDGNLGKRDQWHQGRIEQSLNVALPAGSTLCHVKFDFTKQKFRFDDHFWFTFNDVIMATSIDYRDRFGVTNGMSLFSWPKLVGTEWDSSREKVWCLGGASCAWPKTDTEGTIRMDFRTGTYYAVTARDRSRNIHTFSFVTVGDNDSTDCQHRPVETTATLMYVR